MSICEIMMKMKLKNVSGSLSKNLKIQLYTLLEKKTICPICEKEMLDHNTSETRQCVKQFVDDVKSLDL